MSRSTASLLPEVPFPPDLVIRQTKLELPAEQAAYLKLFAACFPETPKTREGLRFLLDSPLWQEGCALVAETRAGEMVASILAYGNGVTDDVMVLPAWRGQALAKRLIGEGLRYFREHGIEEAVLEVKSSNTPAVAVYSAKGFKVVNREVLLGKLVICSN